MLSLNVKPRNVKISVLLFWVGHVLLLLATTASAQDKDLYGTTESLQE